MKKITLLVVLLIITNFQYSSADSKKNTDFEIKFGLMKKNANEIYYVYLETTNIPLLIEKTGFRFGYTLKNRKGSDFSTYFVIHPSSPLKEYKFTHDIKNSDVGRVEGEGAITRIEPITAKGEASFSFSFAKSDPLGVWKLEIYANGKLLRVIDFLVVSP